MCQYNLFCAIFFRLTIHRWQHFVNHRDRRGANQDDENAGKDKDDQWENQFHSSLCCLFLGDLASFGAHRIALNAKRLGDA